jgi:predicted nucleotidyltransferase
MNEGKVSTTQDNAIRTEISGLVDAIVGYSTPRKIVLFGSRGRGTANADSDIDLSVLYEKLPKRNVEVLQDLYRGIFRIPGHPVDLVVYQYDHFMKRAGSKSTLESAILNEGKVVYG